jgi:mannitol-1-/sugar-/sorbitol-6-phosphatase
MTQVRCGALLFDMDGVLIDSTPAVARVWRSWAIAHHLDADEVVGHAHGRPSIATVRKYLPESDHEAENKIVERMEIEDIAGVLPLPGARELLRALPAERWTIVTSSTRPLAEVRLRAAKFAIPRNLVTSSDVIQGKPHPEPYLKAVGILGQRAEECVVVEDVPAGIRAGKSAGARVIAFPTTCQEGDLRATGADWVLKDCSEISVLSHDSSLILKLDVHG